MHAPPLSHVENNYEASIFMSNERTFSLTYLGRFTAHDFGYSSSYAIHGQLLEYYIAYLRRAIDYFIPLNNLSIQNPIESRILSLDDEGNLSIRSWRYRRYDSKGTLINEREYYKAERIVLCDCLCFEVVQSAAHRDSGVCFAYLRRVSDPRHAIPEANLRELDQTISSWLLRYRRFPRPPLVVIAIHRAVCEQNAVDLLVFLAPNRSIGLDFVRRVTEMTCKAVPLKPKRRRPRTAAGVGRTEASLDDLQRRVHSSERGRPVRRSSGNAHKRPLSAGCLVEPLESMNMQERCSLPLGPNDLPCACPCCQSMRLLPNILTPSELEKVHSRMIQYQLGQEAQNHVYNRRYGVQNYKRPSRKAAAGTQSKLRSRSSNTPNECGTGIYEHNV